MNEQYEVLNPWAEAEPVPLRGISPRVTDLAGKTIGLFVGWKIASKPILSVVESKLKERFPTSKYSWYLEKETHGVDIEGEDKARFEEWVKGIDAAIAAVGD